MSDDDRYDDRYAVRWFSRVCRTCGCPSDEVPMIFRGTGWCCENHRKQQEQDEKEKKNGAET